MHYYLQQCHQSNSTKNVLTFSVKLDSWNRSWFRKETMCGSMDKCILLSMEYVLEYESTKHEIHTTVIIVSTFHCSFVVLFQITKSENIESV